MGAEYRRQNNDKNRRKSNDRVFRFHFTISFGGVICQGAVYTFLESYDFSGKTIVPFCTHESSGLSGTDEAIRAQAADAEVTAGLHVPGADAAGAEAAVAEWLAGIGAESPAA